MLSNQRRKVDKERKRYRQTGKLKDINKVRGEGGRKMYRKRQRSE
jgi:hypothetical protein